MRLAEQLRKSIFQYAIEGKLTSQKINEDAQILVDETEKKINKMVEEGLIRKEKPLKPIKEDEIPFEIPENWVWVKMGNLGTSNIGLTYSPKDISEEGTIVLRSSNIQEGVLDFKDTVKVDINISDSKMCKKGDLLICARNGSKRLVGKAAIIDKEGYSFGAFMALFRSDFNPYLYYYLQSPYFRQDFDGVSTSTINQITQNNLKNRLVPLPPLEEQKRIIDKIEELLPLIEKLELQENSLIDMDEQLPDRLRKSILQSAMEGKLTKQLNSDSSVEFLLNEIKNKKEKLIEEKVIRKEKALPAVSEDEIPFDIPDNWKWVRLNDVFTKITLGTAKPKEHSDTQTEEFDVPMIANGMKDYGIVGYTNYTVIKDKSLLVFGRGSNVGLVRIIDFPFTPIVNNIVFEFENETLLKFIMYVFTLLPEESTGSAMPQLTKGVTVNKLIPLPPLEEQQRIVDKLDQLFAEIDLLESNK